jgi:hypothetical protein
MSYQTLNGTVRNDFRFVKDGDYTNRPAIARTIRRAGKNVTVRSGQTCPSCGMKRSVTNKCECNS